ncbi:unnamed protein product [Pylaiella littoralis]
MMGPLRGLVSVTPLLAGTLLATCLIARGEAFIAPSKAAPLHLPLQHQHQRHYDDMAGHSLLCCRTSSITSRKQQPLHTAAVSMPLAPPLCTRPPLTARRTRSAGGSSSTTALYANGGGMDNPQGPGTQQLSRQAKLAISILIDLIGMSSYALPGLGETTDLGWAPISSAMIFYLYGNSIFAGLAFVEEILPGFDIIPTATIAWFLTNSDIGQNVTNAAAGKKTGRPPRHRRAHHPQPHHREAPAAAVRSTANWFSRG